MSRSTGETRQILTLRLEVRLGQITKRPRHRHPKCFLRRLDSDRHASCVLRARLVGRDCVEIGERGVGPSWASAVKGSVLGPTAWLGRNRDLAGPLNSHQGHQGCAERPPGMQRTPSAASFARAPSGLPREHRSRAPEFYGFVAWSSACLLFVVYVLWALLPDDYILWLGIKWYPSRSATFMFK